MSELIDLKDFTPTRTRKTFTHTGERFELVPAIPFGLMPQFLIMGQEFHNLSSDDMTGAIEELKKGFALALTDESAARFNARLDSKDNPIGLEAIQIFTWCVSELTNRPTEESSDSSNGSLDGTSGSTSTDGAPLLDSKL